MAGVKTVLAVLVAVERGCWRSWVPPGMAVGLKVPLRAVGLVAMVLVVDTLLTANVFVVMASVVEGPRATELVTW